MHHTLLPFGRLPGEPCPGVRLKKKAWPASQRPPPGARIAPWSTPARRRGPGPPEPPRPRARANAPQTFQTVERKSSGETFRCRFERTCLGGGDKLPGGPSYGGEKGCWLEKGCLTGPSSSHRPLIIPSTVKKECTTKITSCTKKIISIKFRCTDRQRIVDLFLWDRMASER